MSNVRAVVVVSPLVLVVAVTLGGGLGWVQHRHDVARAHAEQQRWVAPRAVLLGVVESNRASLLPCEEDAPPLGWDVLVGVQLREDGTVAHARARARHVDQRTVTCVEHAVAGWRFPPSDTPPRLTFPVHVGGVVRDAPQHP